MELKLIPATELKPGMYVEVGSPAPGVWWELTEVRLAVSECYVVLGSPSYGTSVLADSHVLAGIPQSEASKQRNAEIGEAIDAATLPYTGASPSEA